MAWWDSLRPEPPLVLALDVGTSSCRASLFDAQARPVTGAQAQAPYAPRVTPEGGAELDPNSLFEQVAALIDSVAEQSGSAFAGVSAVATSTFWHTLLGVDARGNAVTPVYLWMDARSRDAARLLKRRLDERVVHARTGCVLHWSYWPAKLLWLSETQPELCRRVRYWVSFGEYLALRLFGRAVVSVSMASATGLLDQHTRGWDPEVLGAVHLDPAALSPLDEGIEPLSGLQAEFATRWPALRDIPWLPAVADGACSSVGAGCTTRQRFALMVGTSGALRVLWRANDVIIPWGTWCYHADSHHFVLGGALNNGGSLLSWLRQSLQLPSLAEAEAAVAELEPDAHGLTLLPFWAGERSPDWADNARGVIVGLRLHTTPVEILRAALEAIALRFVRLDAILRAAVPEVREIVATGGALLHSPAWLQIVADALGRPVLASAELEASSRGAAIMALDWFRRLPGGLEALTPAVAQVYEPIPAHTERYRAAAERQDRLYDALVGADWCVCSEPPRSVGPGETAPT